MRVKLAHIADIRTGIFAKPERAGDVVYLQAKHFDDAGNLRKLIHPDLKFSGSVSKHLLKTDDIVFAAKGTKNFASVFVDPKIPAVASTSFFVLQIKDVEVLPEYVTWFLNGPSAQQFLRRNAVSSTITSISKSMLEELELSIPAFEKQKIIVEISRLEQKEREISQRIAELRHQRIQQIITNAIR